MSDKTPMNNRKLHTTVERQQDDGDDERDHIGRRR